MRRGCEASGVARRSIDPLSVERGRFAATGGLLRLAGLLLYREVEVGV